MSKTYRSWDPDQAYVLPPSPQDWLPEGDLVYFVLDTVRDLDLKAITRKYENGDGRGFPPFHPRMMVTLLLYSYTQGVFSSRRIMKRCERDAAYRVIVHDDAPDFRTISDFRKLHLAELESLFVQVLRLCQEAGLVKLGHVSLDGTKIKANASRHKAMSYDRMTVEEARLQKEIDELLAKAQATDASEDERHGSDCRGDELPDELGRRETRLEKIREAKAALEEQARQKAAAHAEKFKSEGRTPRKDPDEATPKPKDQRNFTDPESKIMKTSNKGFDQCGNAQAVANEQQIIIAADVTDQANDVRQTMPMTDQAIDNLDESGVTENIGAFTADTGYFSEENMNALDSNERIDDVFIATGRQKHNDKVPDSPNGRPPKDLTAKQKMARRNRTKKGRAEYARRKVIIEPVFGQIKRGMGFTQFLLNGIDKMRSEWPMVCMAHNMRKLWSAA